MEFWSGYIDGVYVTSFPILTISADFLEEKFEFPNLLLYIFSFPNTVYARYKRSANKRESRYKRDFLGDDHQKEFYEANLDMNSGDSDFPMNTSKRELLY